MKSLCAALFGFILAQNPPSLCETHITGEKAQNLSILVSGTSFSPLTASVSQRVISLRIRTCEDSFRVQVLKEQRLVMDTVIWVSEGSRDSLFFEGGWICLWAASETKVAAPLTAPIVIIGKVGHFHTVEVSQLLLRPEGLLAQQVRDIPGVYLAGAGPLIQKPLLEGLGGTRITYLQEGIPLASQQWGEEHAPEIDPLATEKIYVELGARPVLYGTEAVGGVLGTETPLTYKKPLSGRFSLTGLTNGRGGLLSTTLGGQYLNYQYRLHTTLQHLGTIKTPTYFLSGTASQQANFSLHLRKTWQKLVIFGHYSQYNAYFGLFQGSHVGNLSDLHRAMKASTPPITSTFTYKLLPPYQSATHELAQVRLSYFVSERVLWNLTYARQYNRRSEWDAVGAYALAGKPALDLQLTRHTLLQEMVITGPNADSRLRLGLNFYYERNYAQYAYFIPRYEKYHPSAYALLSRGSWEIGLRLEPLYWVAYGVPERTGRSLTGAYLARLASWWPAWGTEVQRRWTLPSSPEDTLTNPHRFTFRLAYLQRPPNAAELYAYGYHQGRAAFEVGQPTFRTENITHLHLDWLHEGTYVCLSAYHSPTFIYARVDSPIVWIRGASLTYAYQQGSAILLSLTGRHERAIGGFLAFTLQGGALWASYARDRIWRPLPLLPAPYLEPSMRASYRAWQVRTALRFIARQGRYDPEADLAAPPPGYALLSGEIRYTSSTTRLPWTLSLSGDNLLNQPYRQYPDLMRYFANQVGRQVRLTVTAEF